jgi:hypothetical protein
MNKKINNAEFVILTDELERGHYLYQLLNVKTDKSKYIEKYQAEELAWTYRIPMYDVFRWARKLAEAKKRNA